MSCLIRVSHRVVCTSDNISETSDLTIYENGIKNALVVVIPLTFLAVMLVSFTGFRVQAQTPAFDK